MRKAEREVMDFKLVEALLQRAEYIHLAMWDGSSPYVVPVSFGYQDRVLYFHGSFNGKKAECLRGCAKVSFDAVVEYTLSRKPKACGFTSHYQSLVGLGRVSVVSDPGEKIAGLNLIMAHYGAPQGPYEEEVLGRARVYRLDIDELKGKCNPPWQGD